MIEAVIFDVDGTLVDSVDFHAESWERAFARHGHDIAFAALRAQIGKGGDQLMPVFLDAAELKRVGPAIEKERGAIFHADYIDRVKGFPGCGDLFRALRERGLRIALASSSKAPELKVYKAAAGVDGLTDVETSSDDAEKSKPHPDIFEAALARLEVGPDRVVVVGDTPYDAEAARKAGVASIGVLCGGFAEVDIRAAGAARVYRDPADLLAHIDDWAI
ncbi:HAD family hydrolase [Lichenibacterium minor]|uniref:HAD family hydrolase n=1 Tax=Lichenibacterium minor TaxID=2316528 RepID=A0A4Q2U592_9HYPH|nr:HAD family hydrolase [Lichenibacterium minor]RYC31582.1 HAD family hydrolase [Lichenibacterium minor]